MARIQIVFVDQIQWRELAIKQGVGVECTKSIPTASGAILPTLQSVLQKVAMLIVAIDCEHIRAKLNILHLVPELHNAIQSFVGNRSIGLAPTHSTLYNLRR